MLSLGDDLKKMLIILSLSFLLLDDLKSLFFFIYVEGVEAITEANDYY
jgi:hypothetical protein